MSYKKTAFALTSCLIIILFSCQNNQSQCNRNCLTGFIDQYLKALVTHDLASLPLTNDVRYTENGQTLELGDGRWGPANTVRDYIL